jgi:hypothetical protein
MDGDNTASPPRRQWIAIKISDDTSRLLCRFFPAPESRKMHAGKTRRSVPGDHQPLDTISPSAVDHRITLHITENGSCPCPNRKRLQKKGIPPIRPVNHTYPFQQFGFCTIPSFIMHLDFFRRKSLHDATCPSCQTIQTTTLPKRFSSFRRSFPTIPPASIPRCFKKTPINRETTNYPLHL